MKLLVFKSKSRQCLSDDEARRLTGLFLDGATTSDEEQKLYRYYAGSKVASDLEPYAGMFSWFDSLESASETTFVGRRQKTYLFVAAAAITAFVLIGVGLTLGHNFGSDDFSAERIYAGSYIIRHGKKITDIQSILPELERADRIVDSTLVASYVSSPENPELLVLNEAMKNITDPEVKAMLLADIN